MNMHSVKASARRGRFISGPRSGDSVERRWLRMQDTLEQGWPELASWRRMLLPLLGERARVRAVVLVHLSLNRSAEFQLRQIRRAKDTLIAPGWSPALQLRGSWSQCVRKSERRPSTNNTQSGKASVRKVDFSEAPEAKELAEHARRIGIEVYPKILALLADGASKLPRQFDIVLK